MSGINIRVEEPEDEQDTLISLGHAKLSYQHSRQRSRSFMDIPHGDADSGKDMRYLSDDTHAVIRRRSASIRLQLSIPPPRSLERGTAPPDDSVTPQSESPQTPASLTSPIVGVVDLTKDVTTTSAYAVAQGGLSDIYLGEWHRMDEGTEQQEVVKVAIKLLRVFTSRDRDGVKTRKRLNREVYVWHRLEHPNVVKLFGTSYHMAGRPAMVMQWYRNGSAAEYLAHKNPGADRLQLILDVARGLEYLHTMPNPIVHSDLKGNNVLITDDGAAVLCDFGLSQVVEDLGRPAGLTISSPNVGPLRWQAPELTDDDVPTTPATDVWSFGCTAFELLTSRIPYSHHTRDVHVLRDMQKKIKPPAPADLVVINGFGAQVMFLLDSCWSFDPVGRPTMTRVRIDLENICASRTSASAGM